MAAILNYGNVVFGQSKAMTGKAVQTAPTAQGSTTPSQKKLNDNASKAKQERAARADEMRKKGMSEVAIKQHLGPAVSSDDRAVEKTDVYKTQLSLTPDQEKKVNALVLKHENSLEVSLAKAGTDGAARQAIVDADHESFIKEMESVLTQDQHNKLKSFHGQPIQGGHGNPNGGE